ncbi:MAG: hypothetical protein QG629_194 [Patescibacteria group bacterium]|nr:hypothetical protein [Candidatus Saccharibacteria bacterium]MDQ5963112.1 hypothetical protein [Patescibacteria group bacterium]
MHRYLYIYPNHVFNGEVALHELEPLQGSDVSRAVVFAGKVNGPFRTVIGAVCYLYLETTSVLDASSVYKNLRLYENLLCLVSGKPSDPGQSIDITNNSDFDAIIAEYLAEGQDHNKPDIQHHGMVREHNVLDKLPACVTLLNNMDTSSRTKAERALSTFIISEEIGRTVNPHTKATVRASLYLSAINQLAENPEICTHVIGECPVCQKHNVQHQKTSHVKKIEELMRELFTGNNLDNGINLIKHGYYSVRSPFLHDGILSGGENEGGWIADDPANLQFEENLINYMNTCRQLILLFIQKYGTTTSIPESS